MADISRAILSEWSVDRLFQEVVSTSGNRVRLKIWLPRVRVPFPFWPHDRTGTLRNNDNSDDNGNSARASRFFLHFFGVRARLRREMTKLLSFLLEDGYGKAIISTISVWTWALPSLFSANINSLLLNNWATLKNCEMVWKNAESIFQGRFHGRRRCRIVRTLICTRKTGVTKTGNGKRGTSMGNGKMKNRKIKPTLNPSPISNFIFQFSVLFPSFIFPFPAFVPRFSNIPRKTLCRTRKFNAPLLASKILHPMATHRRENY